MKGKKVKKDTQRISLYRVRLEKDRDLIKERRAIGIVAALTRQIAWAGEILGIRLIDHVIIGEDTFYSMKKENPGVSLTDIGLDQEEMDV